MSLNTIVPFFDIDGRDEEQYTSRVITRHSTYYLTGGDLFIQVQRIIFRIHSHFLFRESHHFQRLLASSPHDPPSNIGKSNTRPLILTDITPTNFAIFLWVFYNPRFGQYDTSTHNWVIIHTYALTWDFPEVRHLAERYLSLSDGSNVEENNDDDDVPWDNSMEAPYDDWITTDSITEEFVRLHLQATPLEDGLDI